MSETQLRPLRLLGLVMFALLNLALVGCSWMLARLAAPESISVIEEGH